MVKLSELEAEAQKPESPSKLVAFFPWLKLKQPAKIGDFQFVPFRDEDGTINPYFDDVKSELEMIFSSYVDREGSAVDRPTIVTDATGNWARVDGDFSPVSIAARLLFCACWSANEYHDGLRYVGSVPFRPVWQRFTGSSFISLVSKRRDGRRTDGGYEHGEVKFSLPLQCVLESVDIDEPLLKALDVAHVEGASVTMKRLETVLPFVMLANTDDELMAEPAEAVLMGSAFEQLFGIVGKDKAYKLATAFGALFESCGSVRVEDAKATPARANIKIDTSKPEREAAQKQWWLHKMWVRELYALRSDFVHDGQEGGSKGWTPFQHLLIAALVLPLAIKKLLATENRYELTEEDNARCAFIDSILLASNWSDSKAGWRALMATEREKLSRARLAATLRRLVGEMS